MSIEYSNEQLAAIKAATTYDRRLATSTGTGRIVGISGPAGSGKTSIIKEAVRRLTGAGRVVALAAPTGRAARRIYEATGCKAVTVHKLLEYGNPVIDESSGMPVAVWSPARHSKRPLEYDDIIVDEYAMVNHELHRNLLSALGSGTRLIAVGDLAQLGPVENHKLVGNPPSPFEKIMSYESSVELTHVFRQEEDSGILANATRIRSGRMPNPKPDFYIDVYACGMKNDESPFPALKRHIRQNPQYDYTTLNCQIITPMVNGGLGARAVNSVLQTFLYGPDHTVLELPRRYIKNRITEKNEKTQTPVFVGVGDKVICTTNTYDMRQWKDRFQDWKGEGYPVWSSYIPCPDSHMMLNGEVGLVSHIHPDGELEVDFFDRTVFVPNGFWHYNPVRRSLEHIDPRWFLDLAYCITTHKMQGAECDHVCYFLHPMHHDATCRNNFYTAVTRARETVTVLTAQPSLVRSVTITGKMLADIHDARKLRKQ